MENEAHVTFKQGVKACIPTLLGYAGVGLSFGIVAVASGFSLLEIILLCLLVYAGAAQFIICALVIAGTPISAIVLTAFIVNSRMFLLSMTLAPSYKDYSLLTAYVFWTIACIIGALFGKYIHDPDALGLDFAITAMFIFLAVSQFESIRRSKVKIYLVLIICVMVMMLVLSLFMPSFLAIILASTITAALGVVMER